MRACPLCTCRRRVSPASGAGQPSRRRCKSITPAAVPRFLLTGVAPGEAQEVLHLAGADGRQLIRLQGEALVQQARVRAGGAQDGVPDDSRGCVWALGCTAASTHECWALALGCLHQCCMHSPMLCGRLAYSSRVAQQALRHGVAVLALVLRAHVLEVVRLVRPCGVQVCSRSCWAGGGLRTWWRRLRRRAPAMCGARCCCRSSCMCACPPSLPLTNLVVQLQRHVAVGHAAQVVAAAHHRRLPGV